MAIPTLKQKHPELNVICCETPEEAAADCDALVLLTEWDTFRHLDYNALGQLMRQRFIVDGRNALNPEALNKAGFTYPLSLPRGEHHRHPEPVGCRRKHRCKQIHLRVIQLCVRHK